jgi:predicted RNA-binding Zn ribbon-like protein
MYRRYIFIFEMSSEGKPVRFYFRGGNLALDFVNTVGNRLSETEKRDYFQTSDELLRWIREASLSLPNENGETISPRDLRKATAFRESIYRLLVRQIEDKPPLPGDLRSLNEILMKQRSRMHLTRRSGVYQWRAEPTSDIEWILEQVAEAAATLLTSSELKQLKACQNETCGWLFVDRSRNQPRRWCSMEDCGNRAKARRHYERLKQS